MSAPEVVLGVEKVTLAYGGVVALRDVDLEVRAGQVDGLIGPNGAGKTSLFDVITGLAKPDAGRVVLGGRDVTRSRPVARSRRGLARTFQRLELFTSLTVRENVQVAVEASHPVGRRTTASTAELTDLQLERVGLIQVADARVETLSTGSARLVELARALASEPSVLLVDEPASGLDPTESTALSKVLLEVAAAGLGVLLVEHDVELVLRTCTCLTVMDRGEVIATGSPSEVRELEAVKAAYLGAGAPS